MEETTVAVVRVPRGKLSSWLNTALLLSRGVDFGGGVHFLGAFIGIMTLNSTFIAGDVGVVLWGDWDGVDAGPWGSIVEVVAGGSWWCTVEVVLVAGIGRVSSRSRKSTVAVIVRTRCRNKGAVGSGCKSSRCIGAVLLVLARSTLVHHTALAVLVGLVYLPFHLSGGVHQGL